MAIGVQSIRVISYLWVTLEANGNPIDCGYWLGSQLNYKGWGPPFPLSTDKNYLTIGSSVFLLPVQWFLIRFNPFPWYFFPCILIVTRINIIGANTICVWVQRFVSRTGKTNFPNGSEGENATLAALKTPFALVDFDQRQEGALRVVAIYDLSSQLFEGPFVTCRLRAAYFRITFFHAAASVWRSHELYQLLCVPQRFWFSRYQVSLPSRMLPISAARIDGSLTFAEESSSPDSALYLI